MLGRILLSLYILVVLSISGYLLSRTVPERIVSMQPSPAKIQEEERIVNNPLELEIPSLHITTAIEHVGLTEGGEMDVPKEYGNVAWYREGYKPGEIGNAVIAGHVDTPTGAPAIFADLHTLEKGNILIVWEHNKFVLFKVYRIESYPVNEFPIEEVFGKTTLRSLNLVTCTGSMIGGEYQERLVVYAERL